MLDQVPKPPPGRWIRVSEAAARLGMPPNLLAQTIAAGRAPAAVRFVHLGRRGLLHLAENDLHTLAAVLHAGEAAHG